MNYTWLRTQGAYESNYDILLPDVNSYGYFYCHAFILLITSYPVSTAWNVCHGIYLLQNRK